MCALKCYHVFSISTDVKQHLKTGQKKCHKIHTSWENHSDIIETPYACHTICKFRPPSTGTLSQMSGSDSLPNSWWQKGLIKYLFQKCFNVNCYRYFLEERKHWSHSVIYGIKFTETPTLQWNLYSYSCRDDRILKYNNKQLRTYGNSLSFIILKIKIYL